MARKKLKLSLVSAVTTAFFVGGIGLLVWNHLNPSVSEINSAHDGNTQTGQVVYAQYCASCHGVDLEGEANWQTPHEDGTYPAPPHDETGHSWHHPDRLLFEYTKHGGTAVVGPDFKSNMPGFEGQLSDAHIRAVIEFIKSTWPDDIRQKQARLNARAGKSEK